MSIIKEPIRVNVTIRTRKYYQDKGYNIDDKFLGELDVMSTDIPYTSKTVVRCLCDNCGDIFYRKVGDHTKAMKKSRDGKEYCTKCYHIHTRLTMKELYGDECPSRLPDYMDKVRKTSMEHYGVEHPRKADEVKEKGKKTCLKKYGVEHPSQTEDRRLLSKKLFENNGLVSSSMAQRHICDLVDGKLNHYMSGYYLDVLFENWLDIEYDGSGHDMRVTLGDVSREQFDANERKRYAVIHSKGYKTLTIIGNKNDRLPSDDVLMQDIMCGIDVLKTTEQKSYRIDYSNL